MKIGDVLYNLNEGVQTLFHQDLLSVQPATQEVHKLGSINHRLIATVDVHDMIERIPNK